MEMLNQCLMKQSVKEARWQDWSDSLSICRGDGSTDIILVCKNKEYPAHRFILETSSSYFKTMFHSGLNESKSRQVHFKDMEPETLEAILDYIYKGEVDLIKTEVQIKNVLSASHMMNLTKLFEYCCFMLGESLSKDNVYEIQQIVSTYENITLNEKMLAFVAVYGSEKVGMNAFQDLSVGQMKTVLSFAKIKRLCFDKLLTILVHWLQYDLKSREKEARELFACVDGQLVSKSTISSLLVDDKISSEIISQLLKDVALACTLGFDACSKRMGVLSSHSNSKELNITFFNLCNVTESIMKCFVAQQFDVNTMTWLPPKKRELPMSGNIDGACMCYFRGTVHIIGGNLYEHLLYDIANNEVELRGYPGGRVSGLTGAGLCIFKNKLYVVGGKRTGAIRNLVYCTVLGSADNWVSAPSMNVQRFLPTVLTTSDCIYVIDGCCSLSPLSAEYLTAKARNWTVVNCESVPPSVSRHCLMLNNQLHAVCLSSSQFECWAYKYDKWQRKSCVQPPSHFSNTVNVCQFPNVVMDVILLSVGNPCLPTHAWKPFEGKLKELEPVKGLCEIPNYSCKQYLCCADV